MRAVLVLSLLFVACKPDQKSLVGADATSATVAPPAPTPALAPAAAAPRANTPTLRCADLGACVDACPQPATESCAAACASRLSTAARPFYDAMQACVVPACAAPSDASASCHQPASFACKLCVMQHCATVATACLSH